MINSYGTYLFLSTLFCLFNRRVQCTRCILCTTVHLYTEAEVSTLECIQSSVGIPVKPCIVQNRSLSTCMQEWSPCIVLLLPTWVPSRALSCHFSLREFRRGYKCDIFIVNIYLSKSVLWFFLCERIIELREFYIGANFHLVNLIPIVVISD